MYKLVSTLIFICAIISITSGAAPIAEYRLQSTGPYGDSLSNIFDYTLNGHTGIAYGDCIYISGVHTEGLLFNTSYSYVSVPDHISFSFTNGVTDYDYSMSFWINAPEYNNIVFLSKGHFTIDHEYSCYVGSDGKIMFYMKDNSFAHGAFKFGKTRDSLNKYVNEWLNVVVTHGPGNIINIFVNGEAWEVDEGLGENYTAMQNGLDNFTIGQVNSFNLPVKMDEIVIWDSYLTPGEVLDLYQLYYPKYYNIIILSQEYDLNTNYSLYENEKYMGIYAYGDTINISNMRDYSIVIHEDFIDKIAHIENIDSILSKNVTYIVYVFIFIGVVCMLIWLIRKW